MNPFVLIAGAEPPENLAVWVGSLVLTALVTGGIARFLGRGDKLEAARQASEAKAEADRKATEAEWRAELRSDMKRLLDGQQQLNSTQTLQGERLTALTQRVDGVEGRQNKQGDAHLNAIAALRSEFTALLAAKERP